MLAHQRRRLSAVAFAVLAGLGVLVPAQPVGAAGDPPGGPPHALQPGWDILGATVTCPGQPNRHLSGSHAAAFIESFYVASNLGTIPEELPPPTLPKCQVLANDRINGAAFQFRALYVSQGAKAWVGLPRQEIGPGAFVPADKWYIAHQRVQDAFHGKVDPVPQEPSTTQPSTTTTTPTAGSDDDDSGTAVGWIIVGFAGVALLGVGGFMVRSRRRAGTSTSSATPTDK
jgi:hypothetical protein